MCNIGCVHLTMSYGLNNWFSFKYTHTRYIYEIHKQFHPNVCNCVGFQCALRNSHSNLIQLRLSTIHTILIKHFINRMLLTLKKIYNYLEFGLSVIIYARVRVERNTKIWRVYARSNIRIDWHWIQLVLLLLIGNIRCYDDANYTFPWF